MDGTYMTDDLTKALEEAYDNAVSDDVEQPQVESIAEPTEPTPTEDPTAAREEPKLDLKSESVDQPTDDEVILPPKSWRPDDKLEFSTLPKNIQKILARREEERENGIAKIVGEAKQTKEKYSYIDRIVDENRQRQLAMRGVKLEDLVQQTLAIDEALQRDPRGTLAQLMHSYGVNPADFIQQEQANDPTQFIAPYVAPLQQELAQLKQYLYNQQLQQQQQISTNTDMDLTNFANEKDNSGKPLRPFYSRVEEDMVPLASMFRSQNPSWSNKQVLDEAYNRAVWANPDTRQALLQMQQTQAIAQTKAKAEQAKRAGSSVTGSPANVIKQDKPRGLYETLELAYDGRL